MKNRKNSSLLVSGRVVSAVALGLLAGQAWSAAVIYNTGSAATGTIALGVNDQGHLNTLDPTGTVYTANASYFAVAAKFDDGSWQDATAPGCLCEGWGVSGTSGATAYSGYANRAVDGVVNLSTVGFATDAAAGTGSYATSTVRLTSLPGLTVTQDYRAATNAPGELFVNTVTISNATGGDITDLRYVRVMDWDIPPTEFTEAVSIVGTGTTALLETSHDDGFSTANPLGFTSPIDPATLNVDFIDNNPTWDHGAYFRFNFGTLADGADYVFRIFYGAAANETLARAAVGAEGIELYSFGQDESDVTGGTPRTYIFGFSGVGGTPVEPPPVTVPEPGSLMMLGLAMAGVTFIRRRQRQGVAV